MKQRQSFSFATIGILTLLSACGQGGGTDESQQFRTIVPQSQANSRVSFSELSARIIAPKCLRCHGDFATESGLSEEVTPGRPESSPLYLETREGEMPQGGPRLSESELSLIRDYILGLAPSTVTEPITEPTPAPTQTSSPLADYAQVRSQVLESKDCLRCHADMGTEVGLDAYIVSGYPDQSMLYLRTVDRSMPRRGVPLDSSQLDLIRLYILNKKGN